MCSRIISLCVCLAGFSSAALAGSGYFTVAEPYMYEESPGQQVLASPDVVRLDTGSAVWASSVNGQVFKYDFDTQQTKLLYKDPDFGDSSAWQVPPYLAYGNGLAVTFGWGYVTAHSLGGTEKSFSTPDYHLWSNVETAGGTIVGTGWAARDASYSLYTINFATGQEGLLATVPVQDEGVPTADISGNTIVWNTRSGNGWDILTKQVGSNSIRLVTKDMPPAQRWYPRVGDATGAVIWSEADGIHGVAGGQDLFIPLSSFDDSSVRIDNGQIVWADHRSGDWDIYGYDIAKAAEWPIFTGPGNQVRPDVAGDYVAWADHGPTGDTAEWRIVATSIPEPASLALLALGGLVGLRRRRR